MSYEEYDKKVAKNTGETKLQQELSKLNALDRLKISQEKKLNEHNRNIKSFTEVIVDFMIKHDIHS